MIATRKKKPKHELNLKKNQKTLWDKLPTPLRYHTAKFFDYDVAISCQQTSKTLNTWMHQIWKARLQYHCSFDLSWLQRMGNVSNNFAYEYKKCVERHKYDLGVRLDPWPRLSYYTLKDFSNNYLFNLFKEGSLDEIIKYNPPIQVEIIFDVYDKEGRSLIQWAAKNGHQAILDYFYAKALEQYPADAEINHCAGVFNEPRIYWAACFNQLDELNNLLKAEEINVNGVNKYLQTSLHIAALMGNTAIVEQLLTANAEVNVQDKYGKTPCYEAAGIGDHKIVRLLLNANADINNLVTNASWNAVDIDGNTPLMNACSRGNYEVVSILVKSANVNAVNSKGSTALLYAMKNGQKEILPLLLEAEADIDVLDPDPLSDGDSVLHMVTKNGDMESANLLIEYNADLDLQNKKGVTPLGNAISYGHTQMVKLLLESGASWYETYSLFAFDPKNNVKPEIKRMLVIAELNKQLSDIKKPSRTCLSRVTGFFSSKSKQTALEELKKVVESGGNWVECDKVTQRYPMVFFWKCDVYARACWIEGDQNFMRYDHTGINF